MERLFVDESGTMTAQYCNIHPYFVIAIVRAKDPDKLKRTYKRFVTKNMNRLKAADKNNAMFINDKFTELKGNCFTPQLKRDFVDFFCRNDYFEVFYIVADNVKVSKKEDGKLYNNTARAFNYLLKLALEYYIKKQLLTNKGINIQLDERNERTETKFFLENYLNTELCMEGIIEDECKVTYFDSCNNHIIQIADIFANLMFSQLKTNAYTHEIEKMRNEGYLKPIFKFPL